MAPDLTQEILALDGAVLVRAEVRQQIGFEPREVHGISVEDEAALDEVQRLAGFEQLLGAEVGERCRGSARSRGSSRRG